MFFSINKAKKISQFLPLLGGIQGSISRAIYFASCVSGIGIKIDKPTRKNMGFPNIKKHIVLETDEYSPD